MKWMQAVELPAEEREAMRRSLNEYPSADGATTIDDTGCLSGASYDIIHAEWQPRRRRMFRLVLRRCRCGRKTQGYPF
ncbi:hypothetical protein DIPPA_13465 [Diplonema papillatum]|nr:hypothetical protein DIPPA_13465 [Diplonema papillatum]